MLGLKIKDSIKILIIMVRALFKDKAGKKIVFIGLGGNYTDLDDVAKQAALMGYQTVAVSNELPRYCWLSVSKWVKADVENDVDKLLRVVKQTNARAILTGRTNHALPALAQLASQTGQIGPSAQAAACSTDKIFMRMALDTQGLNRIAWGDLQDYKKHVQPYPVVVKPSFGTGAVGVTLLRSEQDLHDYQQQEQFNTQNIRYETIICEQYIAGAHYDIYGITQGGKHTIYSIIKSFYEDKLPLFRAKAYIFNIPISDFKKLQISKFCTKALNALGVNVGPWHLELREMDNAKFAVIDFANRLGGNYKVVGDSVSRDLVADYITVSLGLDLEIETSNKTRLQLYAYNDREWEILDKLNFEYNRVVSYKVLDFYKIKAILLLELNSAADMNRVCGLTSAAYPFLPSLYCEI